jgi:hypothetical protein
MESIIRVLVGNWGMPLAVSKVCDDHPEDLGVAIDENSTFNYLKLVSTRKHGLKSTSRHGGQNPPAHAETLCLPSDIQL